MAPPQHTISAACATSRRRPRRYSTPTARVPSNRILVVSARVFSVRFFRPFTG